MAFAISSTSFSNGGDIPKKFTCDGADVSPELSWTEPPPGTQSFALIADDPDAPSGTWTHWVLFDLAPNGKGATTSARSATTAPVRLQANLIVTSTNSMRSTASSTSNRVRASRNWNKRWKVESWARRSGWGNTSASWGAELSFLGFHSSVSLVVKVLNRHGRQERTTVTHAKKLTGVPTLAGSAGTCITNLQNVFRLQRFFHGVYAATAVS